MTDPENGTNDPVAAVKALAGDLAAAKARVAEVKQQIADVKKALRTSLAPKRPRKPKAEGTVKHTRRRGLPKTAKPEAVAEG